MYFLGQGAKITRPTNNRVKTRKNANIHVSYILN